MPNADNETIPQKSAGSHPAAQSEILAALKDCQRVLAELGRPTAPLPNIQSIWAQCIAAEARARAALTNAGAVQ